MDYLGFLPRWSGAEDGSAIRKVRRLRAEAAVLCANVNVNSVCRGPKMNNNNDSDDDNNKRLLPNKG